MEYFRSHFNMEIILFFQIRCVLSICNEFFKLLCNSRSVGISQEHSQTEKRAVHRTGSNRFEQVLTSDFDVTTQGRYEELAHPEKSWEYLKVISWENVITGILHKFSPRQEMPNCWRVDIRMKLVIFLQKFTTSSAYQFFESVLATKIV